MENKMKLRIKMITLCAAIALVCTSCSTWRKLNGTEKGAVIGGGTGVVVGNAIAPGVGGTVVGGAIGAVGGGLIGHEEDRHRRR